MKTQKPWYFLLTIAPYIISPIADNIVLAYVNGTMINDFLNMKISMKILFPIAISILILTICVVFFLFQQHKKLKIQVTPEKLNDIQQELDKIVDENEYIESIQAYQYWCKSDTKVKYIKVRYLTGIADERIIINSIMQSYYYFPYSIYNKIKKVSNLYDKHLTEKDPVNRLEYKNEFVKLGTELCQSLLAELNAIKSPDKIKDYHYEMYRTLLRILSATSEKPIERVLSEEAVETALIQTKRSGILGSIILNDLYIFRNTSSISKRGRIYFTFPYDKRRGIIFLASMNQECFSTNDDSDIANYCQTIVSDLYTKKRKQE